jgi:hypothetical protein
MKFNVAVLSIVAATLAGSPILASAADQPPSNDTSASAPATGSTSDSMKTKKGKGKKGQKGEKGEKGKKGAESSSTPPASSPPQ